MRFSIQTSSVHLSRILAALTFAATVASVVLPVHGQVSLFKDDEAREKLVELEDKLGLIQANLRKMASEAAELNNQKQELLQLIRQLSGLVEEANLVSNRHDARITEIGSQVTTESEELGRKIEQHFGNVAAAMVSDDANLYDKGVRTYHSLDYDGAESIFHELLLRYPASAYAHASTFWLGQLQYDKGNFLVSQETLTGLLVSHPDSPRVPDALLLLSRIASEQGDGEAANSLRVRLLNRHPASAAADLLRREIATNS